MALNMHLTAPSGKALVLRSVDLSDIEFKLQNLPANPQVRFYDCETGNFGKATISVNSGSLRVNTLRLNSKSGMILIWEL
jgi:hypothetical protein